MNIVDATDLSEAWVEAYGLLQAAPHHELTNLVVNIANPLIGRPAVREAIDAYLAQRTADAREQRQSCHTVANTIFAASLYRPETENAAERFFARAIAIENHRQHATRRGWGTYLGRLVAFPSATGERFNQLEFVLGRLRLEDEWRDVAELPLVAPETDAAGLSLGLHQDGSLDKRMRGGPCLAHVSLTRLDGRLSMTALYRRHEYETRAYGNFMGLARLLNFLSVEAGLETGELTIVASHAASLGPHAAQFLVNAEAALAGSELAPLETSARPLGASYADLELPR